MRLFANPAWKQFPLFAVHMVLAACALGFGTVAFFIVAHGLYELGVLTDRSWNIHDRPALSLGVLLMVVGIQFFTMGLLGELLVTKSGPSDTDRGYSIKEILEDPED